MLVFVSDRPPGKPSESEALEALEAAEREDPVRGKQIPREPEDAAPGPPTGGEQPPPGRGRQRRRPETVDEPGDGLTVEEGVNDPLTGG